MFDKKEQSVGAGTQFDGTADKGRFEWLGDRSGIKIRRLDIVMGAEAKSWQVFIVDDTGDESELESGSGTVQNVTLAGEIAVAKNERLEVRTTGATSVMRAICIYQDEPAITGPRG
jgi:hypothetical protein